MGRNNPTTHPFASGDRSPLQDVTNSPLNGNAESSSAAQKKSSQSWYARLSDEKKAKILEKHRVARHEKKAAAVRSVNHAHVSEAHASSVGSEQFIPLSNITNTHIDDAVCMAASSAGTAHLYQANIAGIKRSPQSWYAGLSDERRAEYIHKQKMARLARKAATAGVNAQVPTPANYGGREHQLQEIVGQCSNKYGNEDGSAQSEITRVHATPTGVSNLEVDGSDDWLHSNPTYIRRARAGKDVQDSSVPTSFISGRSIEPLDAWHEKDRLRKKKKNTQK